MLTATRKSTFQKTAVNKQKRKSSKSQSRLEKSRQKLKRIVNRGSKPANDSNSSTMNTMMSLKPAKSTSRLSKQNELLKYEKQIAFVLNMMATRIQRAWRKYREKKRVLRPASCLTDFSEKTEEYNYQKYLNSMSKLSSMGRLEKISRLSIDKSSKLIESKIPEIVELPPQPSIDNKIKERCNISCQVIDIKVQPPSPKLNRYDDVYVKTPKSGLTRVMKKCQSILEKKKLSRVLSIQNRYERNQFSQRTYKQLLINIEQSHRKSTAIVKKHSDGYKSSWSQLIKIYKSSLQYRHFEEDSISLIREQSDGRQKDDIDEVLSDLIGQAAKPNLIQIVDDGLEKVESEELLLDKDDVNDFKSQQINEVPIKIAQPTKLFQPVLESSKLIVPSTPVSLKTKLSQLSPSEIEQTILESLLNQFIVNIETKYFMVTNIKMLKRKKKKAQPSYYIDTSLDTVNNWLLEIAHFILDYHKSEFEHNLKKPNILSPLQFLRGGKPHQFQSISLEIFSQFQYYYGKRLKENMKLSSKDEQEYTSLLNVHDLCLYNSLNEAINIELGTGKDTTYCPWLKSHKKPQNCKALLEKAINTVSQWAETSLGSIPISSSKQAFCQQEIYAVIDVLDINLSSLQYEIQLKMHICREIQKMLLSELIQYL